MIDIITDVAKNIFSEEKFSFEESKSGSFYIWVGNNCPLVRVASHENNTVRSNQFQNQFIVTYNYKTDTFDVYSNLNGKSFENISEFSLKKWFACHFLNIKKSIN